MFGRSYAWLLTIWARAIKAPSDQRDRGSTTENVIWIAALAALAITVVGIFGPEILAAAQKVVFQ